MAIKRRPTRTLLLRRSVGCGLIALATALCGCKPGLESATWLRNGFLDPAQQGQFLQPKRNEIRASLSILEEPIGIQDAEEPQPEDLAAAYLEHRIIPGDVLTITIFELLVPGQASTQQVLVSTSGFEALPVLGRVRMAGFTLSELEMELKARLREADILPDPEVQVSLISTRGARFSIIGSIPRPGTYDIPHPDYRLLQAIADAGGVSPMIQKVYVFRKGSPYLPSDEISPATQPQNHNHGSMVYPPPLLTDVSGGATSRPFSGNNAGRTSETAGTPPIDELQILERGPTTTQESIIWDPEKGWVITPVDPEAAERDPEAAPERRPDAIWPMADDLALPVRIIEVPTKDLLMGDPRYNIVIRPFDLINIPPGAVGEFFMMGNIARPGAYDITGRRMTVKEAVASAGGFGPLAWPSRADLIRRISQDEEQIIQLDLDAIFAGNAPDFYLRPNDIVNVGTNAAAPFLAVLRNAFRFSYGFGFVYDRNFADGDTFPARMQLRQFRNQIRQQQGLPIR